VSVFCYSRNYSHFMKTESFFLSYLQDNTLSRMNPVHFKVYCLACPPSPQRISQSWCSVQRFVTSWFLRQGVGRPSPNSPSCVSTPVGCPLQLPSVSGSLVTTRQTVVTCTTSTSLFVLASYHYAVSCTLSILCFDIILWLLRRH
jgi:hypothetical protein